MFDLDVDENDLTSLIHQYHAARRSFDGQPKLLFRFVCDRDVPQNDGVQLTSGDIEPERSTLPSGNSVPPDLRPVMRSKGSHFSARDTGSTEFSHMFSVRLPEPKGKKSIERFGRSLRAQDI